MKELIELIPQIIVHVAPGYILYSILNYQIRSRDSEYKHVIFNSVIISFGINSILGLFVDRSSDIFFILSIIIGVVIAMILISLVETNKLANILIKLNIYKSARNDLISDIVDSKLGMWIYVYIENEQVIYLGKLAKYEDGTRNNHRYVVLSEYSCYNYDGDNISENDDDKTKCVLINIATVTRIELVYNENSKKIKQINNSK